MLPYAKVQLIVLLLLVFTIYVKCQEDGEGGKPEDPAEPPDQPEDPENPENPEDPEDPEPESNSTATPIYDDWVSDDESFETTYYGSRVMHLHTRESIVGGPNSAYGRAYFIDKRTIFISDFKLTSSIASDCKWYLFKDATLRGEDARNATGPGAVELSKSTSSGCKLFEAFRNNSQKQFVDYTGFGIWCASDKKQPAWHYWNESYVMNEIGIPKIQSIPAIFEVGNPLPGESGPGVEKATEPPTTQTPPTNATGISATSLDYINVDTFVFRGLTFDPTNSTVIKLSHHKQALNAKDGITVKFPIKKYAGEDLQFETGVAFDPVQYPKWKSIGFFDEKTGQEVGHVFWTKAQKDRTFMAVPRSSLCTMTAKTVRSIAIPIILISLLGIAVYLTYRMVSSGKKSG